MNTDKPIPVTVPYDELPQDAKNLLDVMLDILVENHGPTTLSATEAREAFIELIETGLLHLTYDEATEEVFANLWDGENWNKISAPKSN